MTHTDEITVTRYAVTHFARARAFYEGLLELKPSATLQPAAEQIEYDVGQGTLSLVRTAGGGSHPPLPIVPVLIEVADLAGIMADLRDARVRFGDEANAIGHDGRRTAIVFDPDGNPLALGQRRAN